MGSRKEVDRIIKSPSHDQVIRDLRSLTEFAYLQGYHEFGYDPVKEIADEVHRLRTVPSARIDNLAYKLEAAGMKILARTPGIFEIIVRNWLKGN